MQEEVLRLSVPLFSPRTEWANTVMRGVGLMQATFLCWLACFYGLQVHGYFASQSPFAIFIQPNHNGIFTFFCYFTEVAALAASSGRAHLFNRVSARVHNLAVLIQYVK